MRQAGSLSLRGEWLSGEPVSNDESDGLTHIGLSRRVSSGTDSECHPGGRAKPPIPNGVFRCGEEAIRWRTARRDKARAGLARAALIRLPPQTTITKGSAP